MKEKKSFHLKFELYFVCGIYTNDVISIIHIVLLFKIHVHVVLNIFFVIKIVIVNVVS